MSLKKSLKASTCDNTTNVVALPRPNGEVCIQSGKYSLDHVQQYTFLSHYALATVDGIANIAEIPTERSPLRFDFDIKAPVTATPVPVKPLHTARELAGVVGVVCNAVRQNVSTEDNGVCFTILTLEKPPRISDQHVKHGFHLHCPDLWCDRSTAAAITETVAGILKDKLFVCGVPISGCVDPCGGKPWLMYGSSKDDTSRSYKLSGAYFCDNTGAPEPVSPLQVLSRIRDPVATERFRDLFMTPEAEMSATWQTRDCEITWITTWTYYLSVRMSIINSKRFYRPSTIPAVVTPVAATVNGPAGVPPSAVCNEPLNSEEAEQFSRHIKSCVRLLSEQRSAERNTWMRVFWALKDTVQKGYMKGDEAFECFQNFSMLWKQCDPDEIRSMWLRDSANTPSGRRVTYASIFYDAKSDNADAYRILAESHRKELARIRRKAKAAVKATTRSAEPTTVSRKTSIARKRQTDIITADNSGVVAKASAVRRRYRTDDDYDESESDEYDDDDEYDDYLHNRLNSSNSQRLPGIGGGDGDLPPGVQISDNELTQMDDTDFDIASMFVRDWGRCVTMVGKVMYQFNGNIWKPVRNDEALIRKELPIWYDKFEEHVSEYLERLAESGMGAVPHGDEDSNGGRGPSVVTVAKRKFLSVRRKCKNSAPQSGVITQIRALNTHDAGAYKSTKMDDNDNIIAFKDMVFCRDTLTLRKGTPEDMISRCLNCNYVPYDELTDEVRKFVNDFFTSLFPDPEVKEYFLLSVAQIFRGSNIFKQYMVWTGVGNNGKSVLIRMFECLLGPLLVKLSKSVLISNKMDVGSVNPDMCKLQGVRLAVTDEIAGSDDINVGQAKLLSGNDTFMARDLYMKSAEMEPIKAQFIPIIVCNDLPSLREPDEAAWKRFHIIPFDSYFTTELDGFLPHGVDRKHVQLSRTDIDSTVIADKHLEGFASLLLKIYIDNERASRNRISGSDVSQGLRMPERVRELLKHHKMKQNPIFELLECKFTYDIENNDLLSYEKLCTMVNDRRRTRGACMDDVKKWTLEVINWREYRHNSSGLIGFVPMNNA
ncbi:ATPase [Heliothis virescens ascovirus 3e]|uniref:ATPase n=1 Tax=Heliothis virescens ascovirus 3e TaxID=260797 RepID=A4KXH3_HVAVE|nr:ATPase [Heliothis virescens ascovirus 3e]ABO37304.1 ATPase [Heliothis virescens ascovirus 3e]